MLCSCETAACRWILRPQAHFEMHSVPIDDQTSYKVMPTRVYFGNDIEVKDIPKDIFRTVRGSIAKGLLHSRAGQVTKMGVFAVFRESRRPEPVNCEQLPDLPWGTGDWSVIAWVENSGIYSHYSGHIRRRSILELERGKSSIFELACHATNITPMCSARDN